jgi:hypothetical protein
VVRKVFCLLPFAFRLHGLVNERDQLEGFQDIILRTLAVSFEVAQGGKGILFGVG